MSEGHVLLKEPSTTPKPKSTLLRLLPALVIALGLGLFYTLGLQNYLSLTYLGDSRASLKAFVDVHFLQSLALFMVTYIVAVSFALPAVFILTIFGGFLFGWLPASAMVVVAATLGASILFLATRSAFGDFLRKRLGGRVAALSEGFKADAFSYLLVLRLAPVFPFFLINIAAALFDVKLRSFVTATFFGIIPGVIAYTFLGQGVDSVIDAAQKAGTQVKVSDLVTPQITLAFAGLAIVAAIPLIIKKLRRSPNGVAK